MKIKVIFLVFMQCVFICRVNGFTPEEKKYLGRRILEMLGVERRPKTNNRHTNQRFLKMAYAYLTEKDHKSRFKRESVETLTEADKKRIDNSDVIITFENVGRFSDKSTFQFDISDVPQVDRVLSAELRLHQPYATSQPFLAYTITVHQLLKTTDFKITMKKIASKMVVTFYSGWISLDLTSTMSSWLNSTTPKKTIAITLKPYRYNDVSLDPDQVGLNTKTAYMVGFFQANNVVNVRKSRGALDSYTPAAVQGEDDDVSEQLCQIYEFTVTFEELEWDVIAPESFTFSYCKGSCTLFQMESMFTSNHAVVQALAQMKYGRSYPKPSCVPSDLSPLTVLYEEQNVILKKYKNMLAESCGCQ